MSSLINSHNNIAQRNRSSQVTTPQRPGTPLLPASSRIKWVLNRTIPKYSAKVTKYYQHQHQKVVNNSITAVSVMVRVPRYVRSYALYASVGNRSSTTIISMLLNIINDGRYQQMWKNNIGQQNVLIRRRIQNHHHHHHGQGRDTW